MPMVGIREVRMAVGNTNMPVSVVVANTYLGLHIMPMIMMVISRTVLMLVAVFKWLVRVRMLVVFGQV